MDAQDLFIRRCLGLAHFAATPAELGRDDLHHVVPFDPFGMSRRREMIRESLRCKQRQRHIELQL
jgi:hypothetical protein